MKKTIIFLIVLLLSGCNAVKYRNLQEQLINDINSKNFKSAKNTVDKENFYKENRSIFLNKIEKGTVYYLNEEYYQSLKYFDEAKNISDTLYSISLKNKAIGAFDTNLNNYYGERYERSMLRFYQSLIHYKLYKIGKYEQYSYKDKGGNIINVQEKILSNSERISHLRSARSVILEWDTLLSIYKQETNGYSSFKIDILAKLWGAYIHEEIGTSEDKQISLQLYKDAKEVLLKNYNLYPSFNKKFDKFEKNFSKLHKMNIEYVKNNFIQSTEYSNDLLNYIEKQINRLEKNNKNNLTFLLKNNFISEKKVKKVKFEIPLSLLSLEDNKDIIVFSLVLLNLKNATVPLIEFELPYIERINNKDKFLLKFYNNNIKETIPLISPNSEIAYKELKDKEKLLFAKIGATTSLKYASAILAAYNLYKQGGESPISLLAARAMFKSAEKIIRLSTMADLRYWSTMPNDIRMVSLNLKNGKYNFEIYSVIDKSEKLIYKGMVDINGENKNYFIDLNL